MESSVFRYKYRGSKINAALKNNYLVRQASVAIDAIKFVAVVILHHVSQEVLVLARCAVQCGKFLERDLGQQTRV
jgi:hypothetical protein